MKWRMEVQDLQVTDFYAGSVSYRYLGTVSYRSQVGISIGSIKSIGWVREVHTDLVRSMSFRYPLLVCNCTNYRCCVVLLQVLKIMDTS